MRSGSILLGLALAPGRALAQDCIDLVQAIDVISAALSNVELDTAHAMSEQTLEALECQDEAVNTLVLVNLFQLAGSVALFSGEEADAQAYFGRAVAVSPTAPFEAMYGDEALKAYQEVQRSVIDTPNGTLVVRGAVEAWLDGRQLSMAVPVDVAVGTHLLQWRTVGEEELEEELENRTIRVAPQEARVLTLGTQVEGESPAELPGEGGGIDGKQLGLLAGGGAGIVAGGVLLGLAAAAQGSFYAEADPDALEGIKRRNNVFVVAGSALGVAGAGLVGVSFLADDGPGLALSWRW